MNVELIYIESLNIKNPLLEIMKEWLATMQYMVKNKRSKLYSLLLLYGLSSSL